MYGPTYLLWLDDNYHHMTYITVLIEPSVYFLKELLFCYLLILAASMKWLNLSAFRANLRLKTFLKLENYFGKMTSFLNIFS